MCSKINLVVSKCDRLLNIQIEEKGKSDEYENGGSLSVRILEVGIY